ncbi:MAG: MoaD/ThiS family protein [Anaerolineales bacterium]|nr:MoaD/ThiS family protein [Anaerolineales bacterium]
MLTVTVFLGTILQKKTPQGNQRRLKVSLDEGASIVDLIYHLDLEVEPDYLLLAVNGRIAELDQLLAEDDKVHLMMPISGG